MRKLLCGIMTAVLTFSTGMTVAQAAGAKAVADESKIQMDTPDISLADLKQAIADKAVVLLDCNGSKSYAAAHIPGAIDFEAAQADLAKKFPIDKTALIVAYCGGPKCLAYKAGAKAAIKQGYTNVRHFSQGLSGWKAAGETTEAAALCPKCPKGGHEAPQEQENTMKKPEATPDKPTATNRLRPEQTVAEIVLRHPQLRELLEQRGIDYCCGGKKPLADAVKDAGLDVQTVLSELEQGLQQKQSGTAATDWTAVPLTVLADHILDTHHVFTKTQLARIDTLLSKVQNAHRDRHGTMLAVLRRAFEPLRAELEAHLMKEEQILFPAIKGIDGFVSGKSARPVVHCGSVANPIGQMEHEHDDAGGILAEMRSITQGYQLPADACQTFTALYEALEALEGDLHEHIHLENNILFPASIKLEQRMNALPITS